MEQIREHSAAARPWLFHCLHTTCYIILKKDRRPSNHSFPGRQESQEKWGANDANVLIIGCSHFLTSFAIGLDKEDRREEFERPATKADGGRGRCTRWTGGGGSLPSSAILVLFMVERG